MLIYYYNFSNVNNNSIYANGDKKVTHILFSKAQVVELQKFQMM